MKTEIADKKLEILNWIFKSKDGASWNEVSEMLNEFERICKDETPVIKAKALRKKGTDEWYRINVDYADVYCEISQIPEVLQYNFDEVMDLINLKPDAELVDLEIRVIEPNK